MSTEEKLRDFVTVPVPKGVTFTVGRRTITAKGPAADLLQSEQVRMSYLGL